MRGLPVLWLYGPPGVGKTTVTWELFRRLSDQGRPVGYVDIDQLGMCYGPPTPENWAPEPAGDHGRHRLEARTLDSVVQNFRDAGVHGVIVPGVVDPVHGVPEDLIPHAALTAIRLRADRAELVARLTARDNPFDDREGALAYADALDRYDDGRPVLDTTGLTIPEVVNRIHWPTTDPAPERSRAATKAAGHVLWLCGPPAVGKSTIGWQVYQQARQAGVTAAFVDLDQIGFRRPVPPTDPGNHRLKAANLAAVRRSFRAAGAELLVAVGPLERPEDYTAYQNGLTITLCLLRASRRVLTERATLRGRGISPAPGLAGDELRGLPPDRLQNVADESANTLESLGDLGDLHVDTDDRPAADIAAEILRRTTDRGVGASG